MGYETTLHLVGIRVAPRLRAQFLEALKQGQTSTAEELSYILRLVDLDSDGLAGFRATLAVNHDLTEEPDDEGFVTCLLGKWRGSEQFAHWLCSQGVSGYVIQHSFEGDGEAWGWELRAQRIRPLELRPCGAWKSIRAKPRPGGRKA